MDRRVFQPRDDNTAGHRRQAIGLALAVLAAGYLALWYLQQQHAPQAPPLIEHNVKVNHAR